MSRPCFLLDEHIPHAILRGLRLRESAIRVFVVGGAFGEPGIETPDPELLVWIEEHGCLLVTNNRATMPEHLANHLAQGRHIPGILIIPRRFTLGATIDILHLIWAASYEDDFFDQIVYL
jgi:hypothetical protein